MTATLTLTASTEARVTRGNYPRPPDGFRFDADVETLAHRWEGYLGGEEPLASFAYFCKTFVDGHGGEAAFGISRKVIRRLGHLSSEAGGRKADAIRDFTGEEKAWLDAVVKEIIRRVGQRAAGITPGQLTLKDLPSL
jgi:hypothetical protein